LDFIESRYDIDTIADEKEIAIDALEWGKNELETIDYTDMIWLPNVLDLKPLGLLYDFIFMDECQDLNRAERELVLKCFKMGTRMVSVGDVQQCLYSFAGSDPESFNVLKSLPNTKSLPLSISYRCGKNIVDYAKRIVKTIEAADNAIDGKVVENVQLEEIKDGDMILCRNNAPLVQIYNEFLKLGKKCHIRGKEIGSNLKAIVKSTKQDLLNADCKEDGVFVRLYDDLFVTRNKIMEKFGIDAETAMDSPQIQNKLDMINALEILSEGINTADEIIDKIDEIFPKRDKKSGISLSTIHKAKGLEADNVFIACRSLMPSKSAKKDWEIRQEYNLMYVAYTRAKNTLGFIDEKNFEKFNTSNTNSIATLRRIEYQVNKVLGKTTKVIINDDIAKSIVLNAKKIDKAAFTSSTIDFNEPSKKPTKARRVNLFANMLKNKK
jgi:superfamily I DNA/RNA helicase